MSRTVPDQHELPGFTGSKSLRLRKGGLKYRVTFVNGRAVCVERFARGSMLSVTVWHTLYGGGNKAGRAAIRKACR